MQTDMRARGRLSGRKKSWIGTKIHMEYKSYTDWTNIWPDSDRQAS